MITKIVLLLVIVITSSCSQMLVSEHEAPLWIRSLETIPTLEGYRRAGVFEIEDKILVQHCDAKGNQLWLKYNEQTNSWSRGKYVTLGCVKTGWNETE
ncbi:MAG: hypothetical protein HN973_00825 [Lentimicrobiaceae bacterium]|nr:hypothetical protein [Lentimicrobiaceae bacterium]